MAIEIYRHKRRKPFIPDKTNFTRRNYQIIGWNEYEHRFNTTPDYRVNELTPKGFSKNIDLYACWKEITNYIYFFNDNPNLIRTDYIPTDSDNDFFVIGTSDKDFLCHEKQTGISYVMYPQYPDYTILPSPETIGFKIPTDYVFDKWIDNKGNEYNIGDEIYNNNNFDKFLYAKLKLRTFRVHFDSNGGIPASYDRDVIMYDKLGELPEPEKQYYSIVGWFDDEGNIVTQDTIITNELTCTCQWMKTYLVYEKVGDVQLDENNIASNFGQSNYLRSLDDINFANDLMIVIKCQTGDEIGSNQETFGMTASQSNLEFGVYNGKFMWEVADGNIVIGQIDVQPNTVYWQKIEKIGNMINCYISTDGINWQLDYSGNRETYVNGQFCIGYDIDAPSEYWRGRIYMDESYIETNGKRFYFKLKVV